MPMAAFASRFPEIACRETRSLTLRGQAKVPDGEYGFLEFYCDEPDCDCRRVLIMVVSPDPSLPVWATLNYGWDNPNFYTEWMGDAEFAEGIDGASLELFGEQSPFADALLRLFIEVVADAAYIARLKRHYALFKASAPELTKTNTPKPVARKWKKHR